MRESYLENIPAELNLEIFSYFKTDELASSSRASKFLRSITDQSILNLIRNLINGYLLKVNDYPQKHKLNNQKASLLVNAKTFLHDLERKLPNIIESLILIEKMSNENKDVYFKRSVLKPLSDQFFKFIIADFKLKSKVGKFNTVQFLVNRIEEEDLIQMKKLIQLSKLMLQQLESYPNEINQKINEIINRRDSVIEFNSYVYSSIF